jgi:serine/threonine protein phosphatase PrpC
MLTDAEIQTLLLKDVPNLDRMATTLVATANRLGGEDNTTVVVIGGRDAPVIDPASLIG